MSGYSSNDRFEDEIEFAPDLPRVEPFALSLDEFIATKSETPAALIGDEQEILLPAHGLGILFAKGGNGKTTLIIDAALHLASGVDWLGFAVKNPLRVLLIENEGPREPFRAKLELKRGLWPHEIRGGVAVCTFEWGALNLATSDHADRLRAFIEENRIDLVIGDPLDSLGIKGVGSPEDTREFMARLVQIGLGRTVAFWLLHHARKEATEDELDAISGAWGGKPDTMLMLAKLPGNRARLSFPKIRWTRIGDRPAYILAFDPETEGFTVPAEEGNEERDYVAEIAALLADGKWRTTKEINAPKSRGGTGANIDTVKAALEGHSDRFVSRTGEDAKEVGRSPTATVWQVTQPSETPETPETPSSLLGDAAGGVSVSPSLKRHQTPRQHTLEPEADSASPETPEPPHFDAVYGRGAERAARAALALGMTSAEIAAASGMPLVDVEALAAHGGPDR